MNRVAKPNWIPVDKARLLENGEAFYPAVFEAIASAREEVLVETFIVFADKVGWALHAALLQAAANGARVGLLFDGYGSADLGPDFIDPLAAAGVHLCCFDPSLRLFGMRFNVLRRMHRKLVVIDGKRAFVGGMNYSADHLADFGTGAKQDYAVEVSGPIAGVIGSFARSALQGRSTRRGGSSSSREQWRSPGAAEAMLVTRDNGAHRNDIERHYRIALRTAKRSAIIANAYFFPGYRLLKDMHRAARRGVDVRLILQGAPDVPLARSAAQLLYGYLRAGGVHIHEYCERALHGKVAVIDDEWATVGSSNLEPLSLALNLEANLFVRDRALAADLRGRLEALMRDACSEVVSVPPPRWPFYAQIRGFLVFHFLRQFSVWASWLPRHAPRLVRPSDRMSASSPTGRGGPDRTGRRCHAR